MGCATFILDARWSGTLVDRSAHATYKGRFPFLIEFFAVVLESIADLTEESIGKDFAIENDGIVVWPDQGGKI